MKLKFWLICTITLLAFSRNINARYRKSKNVAAPIVKLGQYSTFPKLLTLSGFSSGGGFAQHLQISYSSLFSGIAVFQHGFYRCGPGDGIGRNYDNACTVIFHSQREALDVPQKSRQDIEDYFRQGLIENPNNLMDKKLYVYTGTHNWIHSPDISLKILEVYEPYIRNPNAIMLRAQAANLTLPTKHFGGPCSADSFQNYYISNCGLSGPFDALTFLLGKNCVKFEPPVDNRIYLEPLRLFDQTEFTKDIEGSHLMDTAGFLYIPRGCALKKCLVHFYFHGCRAGREFMGENHVRNSGFLEIAELNNIIMVFPQATSDAANARNGWGCWDTYGLNGPNFANQKGAQVTAVKNMISRILGVAMDRKG